jgi:hypothetical protein
MKDDFIKDLRKSLITHGIEVSDVEYTEGNYTDDGILIPQKIPTITTPYCEIGNFENDLYMVFIIHADSFNQKFFEEIVLHYDVQIYGFVDFNKTLYPNKNISFDNTRFYSHYLQSSQQVLLSVSFMRR